LHRLRAYLVKQGLLDDAGDAALEQALNAEIAAAITAVEPLGPPARETLFDDVYAELPWHLAEQKAELLRSAPAPLHSGGRHRRGVLRAAGGGLPCPGPPCPPGGGSAGLAGVRYTPLGHPSACTAPRMKRLLTGCGAVPDTYGSRRLRLALFASRRRSRRVPS